METSQQYASRSAGILENLKKVVHSKIVQESLNTCKQGSTTITDLEVLVPEKEKDERTFISQHFGF
ncbi:conserved hypothetical protein [Ricinus communis]|uniref:Uncharacterized protein n=1 Tax=Ricinus communis TaxID=3988 RepID=B9SJ27_RICCO|nr:conserved hypothetical protein [Ricinus communis]